jgi:hypothetical protein
MSALSDQVIDTLMASTIPGRRGWFSEQVHVWRDGAVQTGNISVMWEVEGCTVSLNAKLAGCGLYRDRHEHQVRVSWSTGGGTDNAARARAMAGLLLQVAALADDIEEVLGIGMASVQVGERSTIWERLSTEAQP